MRLGDLLIEKGIITEQQLNIALSVQRITGQVFGKCLTMLGFISTQELAKVLAIQHGLEYINLRDYPIQMELLKIFPKNLTETLRFLPLEEVNGTIKIALIDPSNIVALDRVKAVTGKKAKPYLTDEEGFFDTIEKVYYFFENPTEKIIDEINNITLRTGVVPPDRLPQLVESLFAEGIRRNATDIHISINSGVVSISYRVDGLLQYAFSMSRKGIL
jgi:Type II secretory pathway, ATPase PulE/Tfp pilus assembly pathway, ATPase PilB